MRLKHLLIVPALFIIKSTSMPFFLINCVTAAVSFMEDRSTSITSMLGLPVALTICDFRFSPFVFVRQSITT